MAVGEGAVGGRESASAGVGGSWRPPVGAVHLPHHPLDIMTLMRIDCATIRFHWPVALVVKRYWRSEGLNRHRISRLRVRRMRALAPACWPLEPPSRSHLEGLGLQV